VFWLGLGVAREHEFSPVSGGDAYIDHLHGLEFGNDFAGRNAAGQRTKLRLERDLQAIGEERDEDVRLNARFLLVIDRPHREVVLEFLESLLDLGELDVERPQPLGCLRREVGTQQVAAFASAHLAQLVALEPELQACGGCTALWNLDLDQIRRAPGFVFGPRRSPKRTHLYS